MAACHYYNNVGYSRMTAPGIGLVGSIVAEEGLLTELLMPVLQIRVQSELMMPVRQIRVQSDLLRLPCQPPAHPDPLRLPRQVPAHPDPLRLPRQVPAHSDPLWRPRQVRAQSDSLMIRRRPPALQFRQPPLTSDPQASVLPVRSARFRSRHFHQSAMHRRQGPSPTRNKADTT